MPDKSVQMKFDSKITVRLPQRLKSRLNGEARRRMLKAADVAREAVADYFARQDLLAAPEIAPPNGAPTPATEQAVAA